MSGSKRNNGKAGNGEKVRKASLTSQGFLQLIWQGVAADSEIRISHNYPRAIASPLCNAQNKNALKAFSAPCLESTKLKYCALISAQNLGYSRHFLKALCKGGAICLGQSILRDNSNKIRSGVHVHHRTAFV